MLLFASHGLPHYVHVHLPPAEGDHAYPVVPSCLSQSSFILSSKPLSAPLLAVLYPGTTDPRPGAAPPPGQTPGACVQVKIPRSLKMSITVLQSGMVVEGEDEGGGGRGGDYAGD